MELKTQVIDEKVDEEVEERIPVDEKTQQKLRLRFNDVDLLTCSEEKFLEVYDKEPIQVAKQCDPELYTKFNAIHNQWLLMCRYGQDMLTILAHRGSYKSTVLRFFLLFEVIDHPKLTYLYLHNKNDFARMAMDNIENMARSRVIKRLVKIKHGIDDFKVQAHKNGLETNLPRGNNRYHITAIGILTSVVGLHFDVIVTDDIVNEFDRDKESKRIRTVRAVRELAYNIRNKNEASKRNSRIINIGTPWHPEDAIAKEMLKKGDPKRTWYKWDCYHTGLLSIQDIYELKKGLTETEFSVNYELKHSRSADFPFSRVNYVRDLDYEDFHGGLMHIDISLKNKGGDYTALTLIKEAPDDNIYVCGKLFASINDSNFKDKLAKLYQESEVRVLYAEGKNNALGNLLEMIVDDIYKLYGIKIRLELYTERDSKKNKARFIEHYWDRIYFDKRHIDKDYLKQVQTWTPSYTVAHDDAFDSLACGLRELKNNRSVKVISTRLF